MADDLVAQAKAISARLDSTAYARVPYSDDLAVVGGEVWTDTLEQAEALIEAGALLPELTRRLEDCLKAKKG